AARHGAGGRGVAAVDQHDQQREQQRRDEHLDEREAPPHFGSPSALASCTSRTSRFTPSSHCTTTSTRIIPFRSFFSKPGRLASSTATEQVKRPSSFTGPESWVERRPSLPWTRPCMRSWAIAVAAAVSRAT